MLLIEGISAMLMWAGSLLIGFLRTLDVFLRDGSDVFFCGSGWQKNAFDLIGWTNIRDDCWHHLRNMWVSNPVIVAFQMFGSLLNHDAMEAMLFPYAPWNMYQTCSCHSGNVGQFPSQSMIFYLTVIHSNSVHISTYIIYNCIYNYIYVHNIYIYTHINIYIYIHIIL